MKRPPSVSLKLLATGAIASLAATGCGDHDGDPASVEPVTKQDGLECRPTDWVEPPACGTEAGVVPSLVDFDDDVRLKARRFDRQFHAFNAYGTGVNADVQVSKDAVLKRALVHAFIRDTDEWDFESYAGRPVTDVVDYFKKTAGLYAGVGIAADAYRYATLRDRGAACAEVDRARQHLIADLDALHLATAITGVEGVIARGFARKDLVGHGQDFETIPIFDADGSPLPPTKNNGVWHEDNSGGEYPDTIWEDSCSRDMLVGWAFAFAAAWEAIRLDPSIDAGLKQRIQLDAAAIARSLMQVREDGYDLEIRDADGRRTLHGILNENSIDRLYIPDAKNGFAALMSLGIVGGFAYVAEQEDIDAYVSETLIAERGLPAIARDHMEVVDLGVRSSYSAYNMAFTGGFLATRYLCDDDARAVTRDAVRDALYERPGRERQPSEQKQTFYDLVFAAATAGGTPWNAPSGPVEQDAIERGVETLREYWDPPFWEEARNNCDDDEIAAGVCELVDGTTVELLGFVGRGDRLVADVPVPMRARPVSNYYWRSNPYEVNAADDDPRLIPAVDFRIAYWMGAWLERPQR